MTMMEEQPCLPAAWTEAIPLGPDIFQDLFL